MNKLYVAIFFFCAIVLTGSTWLIGSNTERVEQFLRDGRYEAAATILKTIPANGSPSYVRDLTALKLRIGDVESLTTDIDNGGNNAALNSIGHQDLFKLERASLKFDPLIEQEKKLADLSSIRETAFLSRLRGDDLLETDALTKIATKEDVSSVELFRLSELFAKSEHYDDAASKLALILEQFPEEYTLATFETEITLRLSADKDSHDVILDRARAYIREKADSKPLVPMIWTLLRLQQPQVALDLIQESPEDTRWTLTGFLPALIETEIALGETQTVINLLFSRLEKATLTSDEKVSLISLALSTHGEFSRKLLAAYHTRTIDLTQSQLRQVGFSLLEDKNDPESAGEIFRVLAANAAPDNSDLKQLLYIIGPRPSLSTMGWLEQRTLDAPSSERAAWLKILISIGDGSWVISRVNEHHWGSEHGVSAVLFELLGQRGKGKDVAPLLAELNPSDATDKSVSLAKMVATLRSTNHNEEAQEALQQALSRNPKDPQALIILGTWDAQIGRRANAETMLGLLFSLDESSLSALSPGEIAQARFQYGELLNVRGNKDEARHQFSEARSELGEINPLPSNLIALSVEIISRLDGPSAAADSYRASLPGGKPQTKTERLLLGRLLTDADRGEEARAVLFEPETLKNVEKAR